MKVVCAALSVALSLAFFDAASALIDKPPRYEDPRALLAPLGAAAAVLILASLAVFAVADRLDASSRAPGSGSGRVAAAIFLCTFVPVATLLGVLPPVIVFRDAWLLAVAAVLASVSALSACLAWLRLHEHGDAATVQRMVRWARFMPFVALIGLAFTWLAMYRIAVRSLLGVTWAGIAFVMVGIILWIAGRVDRTSTVVGLQLALVALVFGGAALTTRAPGRFTVSAGPGEDVGPVILLTVDTLRADRVGLHRSPSAGTLTPNLDRLAESSVVFTDARSPAPWTLPSFASILSGLDPAVHGTLHREDVFPERLTTFTERLRAAGYRTSAIGRNPFLAPRANLDKGFDRYEWFPRPERGHMLGEWLLERWGPREPWNVMLATTTDLTRFATDFLLEQPDRSFFLWLHYFDPHLPYAPSSPPAASDGASFNQLGGSYLGRIRGGNWVPSPEERDRIAALYDAEVHEVDAAIGRLFEVLESRGWYEDSLIVFASDHGEELFDHGGFEHGHTLYDELLRVPLMIKLPRMDEHMTVSNPVSVSSLASTILSVCGVREDPQARLRPDLLRWIDTDDGDQPTAAEDLDIHATGLLYYGERDALVHDRWKLIRYHADGTEELYDLVADPGEQRDLAGVELERVELMGNRLDTLLGRAIRERAELGLDDADDNVLPLDPATLKRLRALGYIR